MTNLSSASYNINLPLTTSDMSWVLNALFVGKVIVYHNLQMRVRERLLTNQEAFKYISTYLPKSFFGYDSLEKLQHYFEAKDGASYFEIRVPRNLEENEQCIKFVPRTVISYTSDYTMTIPTITVPYHFTTSNHT